MAELGVCPNCSKIFDKVNLVSVNHSKMYCSYECEKEYRDFLDSRMDYR